jgi:GT2 family glycosyltransferase
MDFTLSSGMPEKPSLVICTPGHEFSWLWVHSWTHFLPKVLTDYQTYHCFSTGNNIYHVRNHCAQQAIRLLGDIGNLDYVLWIDSDNIFYYDWLQELRRVLDTMPEVSGVGAWYLAQTNVEGNGKVAACNIRDWVDYYTTIEQIEEADKKNELLEVDCLGFGFFLMRGSVFKGLGDHPFTPLISPSGIAWGDDASFLLKAKANGHRFFIHPKMQAPHIKSIPLPLEMAK